MDPQSFIQSGLLEAYVMGQCTAAERAEVERMAAAHEAVRAELEAIELTLEKVAMANAVSPPPGLRDQVLRQIELSAQPTAGSGTPPRRIPMLGWAAAASVCIALAAGLFFSNKSNQQLNERVAELESKVTDCEKQAQKQARMQQIIAMLGDPDTRDIALSDGPEPKVKATVWHNPARQEIVLDINSLPAPAPGKYFQFWAIVDGAPVSMGMVNLRGDNAWQTLPFVANAQAFAISEEDKPEGNPTPTVVVLVGKV
jgi:anti-sigma-K factor RskA